MDFEFISSDDEFRAACNTMAGAGTLSLDTEFVRVRTYYPVLCLIQISDAERIICIDTLAIDDLTPLMDLIDRLQKPLILHAGRQDFEALYQRTGRLPSAVHDTQISAAMVGLGEQVSYAHLVNELFNVELAKSQTRTNWATRPLSHKQLEYAAEDVLYLERIRNHLDERLAALGREQWLREDCAALLSVGLYEPQIDDAWRRCKTRQRLNASQRGVLVGLCRMREQLAAEHDMPRRWLLDDSAVESLATMTTPDKDKIQRILRDARAERRFDVDKVLDTITNSPEAAANTTVRPDAAEQALIDRCVKAVRETAKRLNMSASLLATRRDVKALVQNGGGSGALLDGWREAAIGGRLQQIIAGGA